MPITTSPPTKYGSTGEILGDPSARNAADKCPRICGEVLESRERGRHFIKGGRRSDKIASADASNVDQARVLFLSLYPHRLDQGHLRLGNACGQEAVMQFAPDRVISAASLEHRRVGADAPGRQAGDYEDHRDAACCHGSVCIVQLRAGP